jgi:hypothetical protein
MGLSSNRKYFLAAVLMALAGVAIFPAGGPPSVSEGIPAVDPSLIGCHCNHRSGLEEADVNAHRLFAHGYHIQHAIAVQVYHRNR